MAPATLVEERIVEGDRLVRHMARRGYPVAAAAWARLPGGDDRWVLYLVSERVRQEGATPAFRLIHDILRESPTTLPQMPVRVIGPEEGEAKAIVRIRGQFPRWVPAREREASLGWTETEEVYVYPEALPPRPAATALGRRRLSRAVRQQPRPTDLLDRYTPEEVQATSQLGAIGINPDEARHLIWERRDKDRAGQTIPAGTVVTASYAAWWGKQPEDDPNPLLLVETDTGERGLTFLDNTEPVNAPATAVG